MASLILEQAGARVLLAGTGEEGVEIYREQREAIAAIFLDLTMPGMGGSKTYEILKDTGLDCPVVIMSGYSADSSLDWLQACDVSFLQKPFQAEKLIELASTLVQDVRST